MDVAKASTTDTLAYFHDLLDKHYRALHDRRQALDPPAAVFALEHGLTANDVTVLQEAVRAAHGGAGFARTSSRLWLPFAVHAAEVGYIYDGVEFWPIYAEATSSWRDCEYERDRVREWLRRFAREYGGAVPKGAWANTFRKIAWPITHAVLPRYLQVQLAKMLSDYRTVWPSLLDDPEALGVRLHSWSRHYSDRLEKFCQNTALVGHVAVALLLSGDDDQSPYIESSTLDRLVESLNSERQSRRWLHAARSSASTVRTTNFRRSSGASEHRSQQTRLPVATDPKLQLRRELGTWKAYAVLPDLRPLQYTLPNVYDELRKSRAVVAGAREAIPTGGLLFATAPVELCSWPSPAEAFLQLQRATRDVNLLIADQCRITTGPWWVFRRREGEPAVEVKGKFVRPGARYTIVGASDLAPPDVSWCERVEISVAGVSAYELQVPTTLSDSDIKPMVSAGISVISDVSIRPVGVVANSWDGHGSAEFLAGDPALIAIHAEHSPAQARLTINGEPYYLDWPAGETELFLSLNGLDIGTHEIVVSLGDLEGHGRRTDGTLIATIRDRQVPAPGASSGEGIRLRTSPAQPTLPELWDGHAVIEVDGPQDAAAELKITLRDGQGIQLGTHRRKIQLPVTGDDWRRLFREVRNLSELARHYDQADLADVSIIRAGIGFATVSFERGFQGLRWVVTARHREGGYAARLIDRTDGAPVSVEFFSVEAPLVGETCTSGQDFVGPPRGGLLWATNGEEVAGQIVPPDPNQLLRVGIVEPSVRTGPRSITEVHKLMRHHRQWKAAELPAHPFGMRERQRVLEAITSAMAILLSQGQWAHFEQRIIGVAPADVDLNQARALVGDKPVQRAAATAIANNLWRWTSAEELIQGFSEAIAELAMSARLPSATTGARFVLQLASSPSELLDWDDSEREQYLRCVLTDPVLIRAARFAVLGTVEEVAGGTG